MPAISLLLTTLVLILFLNPYSIGLFLTLLLRICIWVQCQLILRRISSQIASRQLSRPEKNVGEKSLPRVDCDWKKIFFSNFLIRASHPSKPSPVVRLFIPETDENPGASAEWDQVRIGSVGISSGLSLSPLELVVKGMEYSFTARLFDSNTTSDKILTIRVRLHLEGFRFSFDVRKFLFFLKTRIRQHFWGKKENGKRHNGNVLLAVLHVIHGIAIEGLHISAEVKGRDESTFSCMFMRATFDLDRFSCHFSPIDEIGSGDGDFFLTPIKICSVLRRLCFRAFGGRTDGIGNDIPAFSSDAPILTLDSSSLEATCFSSSDSSSQATKPNLRIIIGDVEQQEENDAIEMSAGIKELHALINSAGCVSKVAVETSPIARLLQMKRTSKVKKGGKESPLLTTSSPAISSELEPMKKRRPHSALDALSIQIGLHVCIINNAEADETAEIDPSFSSSKVVDYADKKDGKYQPEKFSYTALELRTNVCMELKHNVEMSLSENIAINKYISKSEFGCINQMLTIEAHDILITQLRADEIGVGKLSDDVSSVANILQVVGLRVQIVKDPRTITPCGETKTTTQINEKETFSITFDSITSSANMEKLSWISGFRKLADQAKEVLKLSKRARGTESLGSEVKTASKKRPKVQNIDIAGRFVYLQFAEYESGKGECSSCDAPHCHTQILSNDVSILITMSPSVSGTPNVKIEGKTGFINVPFAFCLPSTLPTMSQKLDMMEDTDLASTSIKLVTIHGLVNNAAFCVNLSANKNRKSTDVSVHADEILVREWRGDLLHRDSLMASNSLPQSSLSTTIVKSSAIDISVTSRPSMRAIGIGKVTGIHGAEAENVQIKVGPADLKWSPAFHLIAVSALHRINDVQKRVKSHLGETSVSSPKKKKPVNVLLESGEQIHLQVTTCKDGSQVDVFARGVHISVASNIPGRSKPDVDFKCAEAQVFFDEIQPALVSIVNFSFSDIFRLATLDELNTYEVWKTTAPESVSDELIVDGDNRPLKELVDLRVENVIARISPELQFGHVLSDILITAPTLFSCLREAKFMKPKPLKRKYQLMTISAGIANADVSLLERDPRASSTLSSTGAPSLSFFSQQKDEDNLYIHRFRCFGRGINLVIERNAPPSYTQNQLNKLDEDPCNSFEYGPEIQGGDMIVTINHIVVILDPLNLSIPLAVVHDLHWNGLFLLAQLSNNPKLRSPSIIEIPMCCFHPCCRPLPSLTKLNSMKREDICCFGIALPFRGIPQKVFLDGSVRLGKVAISFGPAVQHAIPKLNAIIKRLQPPSVEKSPPPMGWWDNLRFWIHGRIQIQVKQFAFRWLLDAVNNYEWSILVECTDLNLFHTVGSIKVELKNLVLSVPNQKYYMIDDFCIQNSDEDKQDPYGSRERQSLLLIPYFTLELLFSWSVACLHKFASFEHHSPYLLHDHQDYSEDSSGNQDKFFCFRSHGVKLKLKANMSGDTEFTNWVALRIDVIPWLTHKVSPPLTNAPSNESMPISEESSDLSELPGPVPRIESLSVNASTTEIRIALWYGVKDTDGLVCIMPTIAINSSASLPSVRDKTNHAVDSKQTKDTSTRLVSRFTNIEVGGLQGALLDITASTDRLRMEQKNGFDLESVMHNHNSVIHRDEISKFVGDDISDKIESYDRMIGLLGATEEEEIDIMKQKALPDTNHYFCDDKEGKEVFEMLQIWFNEISELDYLVVMSNLVIIDRSLDALSSSYPAKDDSSVCREGNNINQENSMSVDASAEFRPLLTDFALNHQKLSPLHGEKHQDVDDEYDESRADNSTNEEKQIHRRSFRKPQQVPWSVLISGMKLLWTLEIRDAIVLLFGDLITMIDFMRLQLKEHEDQQSESFSDKMSPDDMANDYDEAKADRTETYSWDDESKTMQSHFLSASPVATISGGNENVSDGNYGSLSYLLERHNSSSVIPMTGISVRNLNAINKQDEATMDTIKNESLPMIDIRLSNPQIQLHSITTGGSIILAMKGAYVEGRSFLQLFLKDKDPERELITSNDLLRKIEFKYTLDKVEAFAVSTDVDVNAGLQWLELIPEDGNKPCGKTDSKMKLLCQFQPMEFAASNLSRKILNECTFFVLQETYRPPMDLTEKELEDCLSKGLLVKVDNTSKSPLMDRLDLRIDELSFMLDSHQFSTTIDLIRNVFLMPMPVPLETTFKKRNASAQEEPSDSADSMHRSTSASSLSSITKGKKGKKNEEIKRKDSFTMENENDSLYVMQMSEVLNQSRSSNFQRNKKAREALRNAAQQLALNLEKKHILGGANIVRRIEWRLGKAKWKIHSVDFLDDVEVVFTELHGQHDFFFDRSMTSQIDLEDLSASSLKPGPDSIEFMDPTTVVNTALGAERSPCQRCGAVFYRSENEINSCSFHADEYGRPGMFHEIAPGNGVWSCCNSNWEGAPGCKSRPHTSRERAILIRVEALPRVVEGLTLYKHFEVNIYPSVPHTLIVQVTRSLAGLFMTYFMGEENIESSLLSSELASIINETKNETKGHQKQSSSTSQIVLNPFELTETESVSSTDSSRKTLAKKGMLFGTNVTDDNPDASMAPTKANSAPSELSGKTSTKTDTKSTKVKPPIDDGEDTGDSKKVDHQEMIFMKLWRIGYINAQVSFAGFPVVPDTHELGILVPAFSRGYKVGPGNYLGHKYISHLIHEVAKSVTSSGFGKIREKISGYADESAKAKANYQGTAWYSPTRKNDNAKLVEDSSENEAARADLILGTSAKKKPQPKKKLNIFIRSKNAK